MKVGDKIKIDFAGKKKDATVDKVFPKTVYLKVDFDKDKQKTVKRKISQVDGGKSKKKQPLRSRRKVECHVGEQGLGIYCEPLLAGTDYMAF